MALRRAGESFSALALPPLSPPFRFGEGCLLDSLTVSGESPVAISTISLASWFGSRGRFGMSTICHSLQCLNHMVGGQTVTLPNAVD